MSSGFSGFGGGFGGGPGLPGDGQPDPMGHVDPTRRQEALRRLELRALQWRAAALAEVCFAGPVVPRLLAGGPGGSFSGMLELEVPFDSLEAHREAEARFLGAAARDEVLGSRRLLFVFRPGDQGEAAPRADAGEAA